MSARDWRDAVLEALRVAVRRRMVADVPVGVLLSGGLDSSLVVALLADEGQIGPQDVQRRASTPRRARAATSSSTPTSSPSTSAPTTSRSSSTPHRMLPAVDAAITAMTEPMVSHDCVAFYLLSEEVAKSVKVVQSGQGADEVFAGYSWYPPLAEVPRAPRRRTPTRGCSPTARTTTCASILEPEWLLARRPEPRVRRRALRPRRAPTTRSTPRCASTRRSCWSTTRSSGSTT